MRRDKNAPRLYELLGENPPTQESIRRPRPVRSGASSRPGGESGSSEGFFGLFKPGNTIQVPSGYAFFALAALLLAVMLGYFIGYIKRGAEYQNQLEREAALTSPEGVGGGGGGGTIRDPLSEPIDNEQSGESGSPQTARDTSNPAPGAANPRAIILERGEPDPREPGLNYFVVARLPIENAIRAAEYLTERGVPAIRLAPDDDKWCKVVALIGFDAGSLRGEKAEQLRDRVLVIGRDFKRVERGGDDFASMYAEKFTGP